MATTRVAFGGSWAEYWPAVAMALLALCLWAVPFVSFTPHDYGVWLRPWYEHILAHGRVEAFAQPFSNYTPPYLYLLSAASLLDSFLHPLVVIKLVSTAGAVWVAFAVSALLKSTGAADPSKAGLWSLFLPTIIFNVPILAQADAFWVAPCILAVKAATEKSSLRMTAWASVGLAFKLQAIFIAPFVIAVLFKQRAPLRYWAIPLVIYALAMLPAWLVGWPATDLATVYWRQVFWAPPGVPAFVSSASNYWLVFKLLAPGTAAANFWLGYVAAGIATLAFCFLVCRRQLSGAGLMGVATISAAMLPWLLPGMHERYFALAEILAFCLAWLQRDQMSLFVAFLLQGGALFSIGGWLIGSDAAAVAGFVAVTLAIVLLCSALLRAPIANPEGDI